VQRCCIVASDVATRWNGPDDIATAANSNVLLCCVCDNFGVDSVLEQLQHVHALSREAMKVPLRFGVSSAYEALSSRPALQFCFEELSVRPAQQFRLLGDCPYSLYCTSAFEKLSVQPAQQFSLLSDCLYSL
jgi:hypothetical protein